ncbi:MAG: helix-turn-helix domain-containing protein [Acidobacteria bacterium]|nr:helix-turn-helix domain-containing protein [Acidobacteriota bacterium]
MTDPTKVHFDISDEELLERYLSLSEKQREEEFLTTACAAEIAGMSQRTIQLWVDVGDIRAIYLGRKCIVHRESLMAYLKSRNNDH